MYCFKEKEFNVAFKDDSGDFKQHSLTKTEGALFPFGSHDLQELKKTGFDLKILVSQYFGHLSGEKNKEISFEQIFEQLKTDLIIDTDLIPELQNIVKDYFFTEEGTIRPLNLTLIRQVNPKDSNVISKIGNYMAFVLGDKENIEQIFDECFVNEEEYLNVFEQWFNTAVSKTTEQVSSTNYYKVKESFNEIYEKDFRYLLSNSIEIDETLSFLLNLYYLSYTSQTLLTLNQFSSGSATENIPLYFCFGNEKTDQNRDCYLKGWKFLQPAVQNAFIHAVFFAFMNIGYQFNEMVDYITLKNECEDSFDRAYIISQLKTLLNCYKDGYLNKKDDKTKEEFQRKEILDSFTLDQALKTIFDCIKLKVSDDVRKKVGQSFELTIKQRFLKPRGRNGNMLTITEADLISLTKICIKGKDKILLNSLFEEFQKRGIYFDSISKKEIEGYFEKLSLIDKKSDSGEAKYVKRI